MRYGIYKRYLKNGCSIDEVDKWFYFYAIGAGLSGIFWGWLGAVVAQSFVLSDIMLLYLTMLGLAGATIAVTSAAPLVFIIYSVPMLGPMVVVFLFSGNIQHQTLGFLTIIYILFTSTAVFRNNNILRSSIEDRYDKEQLATELQIQKDKIQSLNTELKLDIAERNKITVALQKEKQKVEGLAKELYKLSTVDGLTMISNRRAFDETIEKEWKRCMRSSKYLALIIIDIDFFKDFNDTYGHIIGDECLISVAKELSKNISRSGDFIARYGGEEFVIVLPNTQFAAALELAEKMRKSIESMQIIHKASNSGVVTISAGISAVIPQGNQSPILLLEQADKALYKAKENGRNSICLFSDIDK
ncbi:MAG: GGDEF domain-containing protein [Campylobacterota bacterium]|nr:GGDEF domain-containing protein [Campylobacterota bacterium]